MPSRRDSSRSNAIANQLRLHKALLTFRQFADPLKLHQERACRGIHDGMPHLRMRGRRSVFDCLRMTTHAANQAAAREAPTSAALGKLGKHIAGDLKSNARQAVRRG